MSIGLEPAAEEDAEGPFRYAFAEVDGVRLSPRRLRVAALSESLASEGIRIDDAGVPPLLSYGDRREIVADGFWKRPGVTIDRLRDVFFHYLFDDRSVGHILFTPDGILDASSMVAPADTLAAMRTKARRPGPGAFLGDRFASGNPSNVLFDHACRGLEVRRTVGKDRPLYLHGTTPPSAREVCRRLLGQVRYLEPNVTYHFQELLVFSNAFAGDLRHPIVRASVDYRHAMRRLRDETCRPRREAARRLFVQRPDGAGPPVVREPEICAALKAVGFRCAVLDALPVRDQLQAVHDADVVIGVHGPALANLIAARAGTRVIEIVGRDAESRNTFRDFCGVYDLAYERRALAADDGPEALADLIEAFRPRT